MNVWHRYSRANAPHPSATLTFPLTGEFPQGEGLTCNEFFLIQRAACGDNHIFTLHSPLFLQER
ncbi:MAG: hypothetical protein ACI4RP_02450 [Acutalibacteraceae bacterium]